MNTPQTPRKPVSQKLITIYLDNTAYGKGKLLVGSFAEKHGLVEEHLSDFLTKGWRVAAIHGFSGSSENIQVRGWITVLLEMTTDDGG
jgi:hypothetical protein